MIRHYTGLGTKFHYPTQGLALASAGFSSLNEWCPGEPVAVLCPGVGAWVGRWALELQTLWARRRAPLPLTPPGLSLAQAVAYPDAALQAVFLWAYVYAFTCLTHFSMGDVGMQMLHMYGLGCTRGVPTLNWLAAFRNMPPQMPCGGPHHGLVPDPRLDR